VPCDGDSRASTVTDLSKWQQLGFAASNQALILPRDSSKSGGTGISSLCDIFSIPSLPSSDELACPTHGVYQGASKSDAVAASLIPAPSGTHRQEPSFVVRSLQRGTGSTRDAT